MFEIKKRPGLPLVLLPVALVAILGIVGCDDGGGGGFGLDDGTGPDGETPSMCDDYPVESNAFSVGSVPRNYTLFDKQDREHQLCDYAVGNAKLLFLAITDET